MAVQDYVTNNWLSPEGKPAGGNAYGPGFTISWQNGPLGRDRDRKEPNGAYVETILFAVRDRLQHYQDTGFKCEENEDAIDCIHEALSRLRDRTFRREREGTEGTWEGK